MQRLNSDCIKCILYRYLERVPKELPSDKLTEYYQSICKIIGEASTEEGAPVVVHTIKEKLYDLYGVREDFTKEKYYFNHMMLLNEPIIEESVYSASDPLKKALQYAMTGNYIDFGTMNVVNEEYLQQLLKTVEERPVSEKVYLNMRNDLSVAKKLMFITDNCGEIVLDKVLIKSIKQYFPQIDITVMVRGGETINDATMTDAQGVGMTELVKVIHNGNDIAGTCLNKLSEEALRCLDEADLILSKGQANFETLRGCGKNIYYIFLCKCDIFANRFGVEKYTGMFLNDIDYINMMDGKTDESVN